MLILIRRFPMEISGNMPLGNKGRNKGEQFTLERFKDK